MKLNPEWIVGFVDGEGYFHIAISKHSEMTIGYQVLPEFTIVQHIRDVQVLYAIKTYFGCGVIRKNHDDRMAYRVRGFEHLTNIIVPFFSKYPLKTKKHIDFLKFRDVLRKMESKEHLDLEGIENIHSIKGQMNRSN
jgi:hypothetical protein